MTLTGFIKTGYNRFCAAVAQLVEQLFRKQQAGGSTPLGGFFFSVKWNLDGLIEMARS